MPAIGHALAFALLLVSASPVLAGSASPYPSADREWTRQDYSAFYFTYYNTRLALPHLRDAETRRLFERLTARQNIEAIAANNRPAEDAVAELRIVLAALGSIRASYNYAVQLGEPLQEELVRFQEFMLFTTSVICELSGDHPPDRASASAMKTIILGVFFSLSETAIYTPDQTARLSDALARRFHLFAAVFPETERQDMAIHVERLEKASSDGKTRLALARLRQTIASR